MTRPDWRASLLLLLLVGIALQSGCRSPVGIHRVSTARVNAELLGNVLTGGELSRDARNLINWADAFGDYRRDPEQFLAEVHEPIVSAVLEGSPVAYKFLVSLAEIHFHRAVRTGSAGHYVMALAYAWAYLFPPFEEFEPELIGTRAQLAVQLYNRSLALALTPEDSKEVVVEAGRFELPVGHIEILLDDDLTVFDDYLLTDFHNVTEYRIRGFRNQYRLRGIGAPLAAGIVSASPEQAENPYLLDELKIPVTVILHLQHFWERFPAMELVGRLEVELGLERERTKVEGVEAPIELHTTASLAFMLAQENPWRYEMRQFFLGADHGEGEPLRALEPYRPGAVPVVFVHGTASSSARWADTLNDLSFDPRLRAGYQVWLFTYNTSAPIAYSAWLLRQSIRDLVARLDPEGRDAALRRIVVVGHSQGGLLAKLTAVDAGSRFWDIVSDDPIDDFDMSEQSYEVVKGSLFPRPLEEVERLVYLATPHRGSYVAAYGPSRLLAAIARSPARLVQVGVDLATADQEAAGVRRVDDVGGAITNMSPGSEFIQVLADLEVEPGVEEHSIIAVRGWPRAIGPDELMEKGTDGVVRYESAHVPGVESELIVDSDHSNQGHPLVVLELARILLEHIGAERPPIDGIEVP